MQEKDNINNELLDYSKKNSFLVPEGYFENFSNRLNERILNEQKSDPKKKTLSLKIFINSKLAMAASLLVFVTISYFTINIILNKNKASEANYYSDLVEDEIADFDLGLLAEFYETDEASTQYIDFEDNANIIDFLVSEDIDLELIIEEL